MISIIRLLKYNIQIIFAGKFIYFMLAALGFYLLMVVQLMLSDSATTTRDAYNIMLVPAVAIIFYPSCFGIQGDQDNKILEVLFGIPNYRYKVWVLRLFLSNILCMIVVYLLSLFTNWGIVDIPIVEMTLHVMVPTLFASTLAFVLSTVMRNGNGSAVCFIVIILLLLILSVILGVSKWNILQNPFNMPINANEEIFRATIFYNRIIIITTSIIFLLTGLTKLQSREKYI